MAVFDDFSDMRFTSSSDATLRPRRSELASFDEVLDAARAGDSWAFDLLFRRIQHPLRAFGVARGAEDPDGLVNEVLSEVFGALPTFTGDESAYRGFVFHVARRRLIDGYRRRSRRVGTELRAVLPEPDPRAARSTDSPESMPGLALASTLEILDSLTADQRDVLVLRVVCDLSLVETAAALDKPVTAIKALQRRGIGALRRQFADLSDETVSW